MGIIKDIAITGLELRNKVILDTILPFGRISVTIQKNLKMCEKCGNIMADVFTKATNVKETTMVGEIHVIYTPSTRLVLGIHPNVHNSIEKKSGKNITFGTGESKYFCHKCIGWSLPESIAKAVPAIQEQIDSGRDPVIDHSRRLFDGYGCWITVTEFPLDRCGRFLNYQTDFKNFIRILSETKLENEEHLAPHIA